MKWTRDRDEALCSNIACVRFEVEAIIQPRILVTSGRKKKAILGL